ncbi:MAG TPA: cell envelope biogenesis protein OmpA, partial [Alcanivorax sp.]|nr:cell envelope biogenesis protein OmpA [Alcanivorax sp.]HBP69572.1 cell envelope biogenesis protein OmpA [Alcanivorax sp.]
LSGYGVQAVRMDVVGFGETQPIADNGSASGRQQNRRVELTLIPYEE